MIIGFRHHMDASKVKENKKMTKQTTAIEDLFSSLSLEDQELLLSKARALTSEGKTEIASAVAKFDSGIEFLQKELGSLGELAFDIKEKLTELSVGEKTNLGSYLFHNKYGEAELNLVAGIFFTSEWHGTSFSGYYQGADVYELEIADMSSSSYIRQLPTQERINKYFSEIDYLFTQKYDPAVEARKNLSTNVDLIAKIDDLKARSASACYVLSEVIDTANWIIASGADSPLLESYKIALPMKNSNYNGDYAFYGDDPAIQFDFIISLNKETAKYETSFNTWIASAYQC